MAPTKRKRTSSTTIKTGDIHDVSGNINIAGGDITTHHSRSGLSAEELGQLFNRLYQEIDVRDTTSSTDKEDIKADVKDIQTAVVTAAKSDQKVDEDLLSRKFRSIARMAPDILDVVVATLANPLAGLGVAVKKIAERATEGTTSK